MEIFAVTIPIFIFVIIGYIGRKRGIIGEETKNFLSKIVYYLAMPALIMRSILSFDFASTFKLKLVAHNLTVTIIVCIITFFTAFLIKDVRKRGAFNMSCFRSNQGYIGLPVVNGFYGEEAMSKTAVINGFDSPVVILLSALALEIFRGRNKKSESSKTVLKVISEKIPGFLTNPFVLAAVVGFGLSYLKVPLLNIKMVDELLKITGYMALPLALISIGCSIKISHLKNNFKLVLVSAVIKLLAMPAIAFLLAHYVFKFTGTDLGLSVILTATPTSVSSYIMATEMDADDELMASSIGFTTFVSVVTISLIKYLLS